MNYQLFSLTQMLLPLFATGAASIVYFKLSTGDLAHRLFSSLQGIFLISAASYAIALSVWSEGYLVYYFVPFWMLLALSLAALIYSVFQYHGRRAWVHVLQVVLLPCTMLIWFIGTMTIARDWL